jgi:UDP-N-acetyl-2-amino-2-deoxyglucuronate dehydrogenase
MTPRDIVLRAVKGESTPRPAVGPLAVHYTSGLAGVSLRDFTLNPGVPGKVSVNADCIMPYRFPFRIFGSKGSVFDNRIWSHKFPGQKGWIELPSILPDSSDVGHHPFQGEMDHFVECVRASRESHCNLEDVIKTHEVVFAALRSYETEMPVRLPLTDEGM